MSVALPHSKDKLPDPAKIKDAHALSEHFDKLCAKWKGRQASAGPWGVTLNIGPISLYITTRANLETRSKGMEYPSWWWSQYLLRPSIDLRREGKIGDERWQRIRPAMDYVEALQKWVDDVYASLKERGKWEGE